MLRHRSLLLALTALLSCLVLASSASAVIDDDGGGGVVVPFPSITLEGGCLPVDADGQPGDATATISNGDPYAAYGIAVGGVTRNDEFVQFASGTGDTDELGNASAPLTVGSVPGGLSSGNSVQVSAIHGGAPEILNFVPLCSPPSPPSSPSPPSATVEKGKLTRLAWDPVEGAATYEVERVNASAGGDWTSVVTDLQSSEWVPYPDETEPEGTWRYRVTAHGAGGSSASSLPSEGVVLDRTPPTKPLIRADRAPEDLDGGWYKDTVDLILFGSDDQDLPDGTSGIGGVTYAGPQTFATHGLHSWSGTASDAYGNESELSDSLGVKVDTAAPQVQVGDCPTAPVAKDSEVKLTVAAIDPDPASGLVGPTGFEEPLPTATIGPQKHDVVVYDKVGHSTTESCHYVVELAVPAAPTGVSASFAGGVSWDAVERATSYVVQHRDDDDDDWSDLSTDATSPLSLAGEADGTWTYRVVGVSNAGRGTPSQPSDPVKVDTVGPTVPTATADRAPEDAVGGWFKNTVTVTLSGSVDPDLPDGSAGVGGVTYDGPFTEDAAGESTPSGVARDARGNASSSAKLTVRVDKSAPELNLKGCPEDGTYLKVGTTPLRLGVYAKDPSPGSGLVAAPVAPALSTGTPGWKSVDVTATDRVGHATTRTCKYLVHQTAVKPGTPTAGSPNRGAFTLKWSRTVSPAGLPLTYRIQRSSASTVDRDWSTIKSGIGESLAPSYTFTGEETQPEGQFVYRVIADDGFVDSAPSTSSRVLLIDRTKPPAPTVQVANGQTRYGPDNWFKDQVVLDVVGNGDLGAPPSGLRVPAFQLTWRTNGRRTVARTVSDKAGNVSDPGTLEVPLDAKVPSLYVGCPATAKLGSTTAKVSWSTADAESGVNAVLVNGSRIDPVTLKGTVPIPTGEAGPVTTTIQVEDGVGHLTTLRTCITQVVAP